MLLQDHDNSLATFFATILITNAPTLDSPSGQLAFEASVNANMLSDIESD